MLLQHDFLQVVVIKQIFVACDKKATGSAGGQIQQCIIIWIAAQAQIERRFINQCTCAQRANDALTTIIRPNRHEFWPF